MKLEVHLEVIRALAVLRQTAVQRFMETFLPALAPIQQRAAVRPGLVRRRARRADQPRPYWMPRA